MKSICSDANGVFPARVGRISFFSGRQCGRRRVRVLLGGVIERGSGVVVDRDRHVELGFRHDHSYSNLNLRSNYCRFIWFHAKIVVTQKRRACQWSRRVCGGATAQLKTNGKQIRVGGGDAAERVAKRRRDSE
jgi:hypothetical protein